MVDFQSIYTLNNITLERMNIENSDRTICQCKLSFI
jgi:hypothetical protein